MLVLLNGVTTVVNGSDVNPRNAGEGFKTNTNVHVDIAGGTATVKIQGKSSPNQTNYADLATVTTSGVSSVALMPIMRAITTAISGATVRAEMIE